MIIRKSEFICSSNDVRKCPASDLPEYAFTGRSNVGKSSLINLLVNRRQLARTSSKPGKTQLINHFLINDEWFLVDLPGYGFARAGKGEKGEIKKIISDYVLKRKNLACLFILLDSRLDPQEIDILFISWLGTNKVPFVLVFTKTDKISMARFERKRQEYESLLLKSWVTLPYIFTTSANIKTGRDEILEFIDRTNKNFKSTQH